MSASDGGTPAPANAARRSRDLRLDLFRGLAMLIIFVAHVPDNGWNSYIPARFGFSNATEIFVFCSGFASALAFGSVFVKRGLLLGTARILFRCWQVYWAHVCLFVALFGLYAGADAVVGRKAYVEYGGFEQLIREPARAILGLVTLRWQTDYLDILPMYLVILAMVPVVMALKRAGLLAPFAAVILLYVAVWVFDLHLVADPWTGREWFLNPFAWQLIFFLGFSFAARWLPAPPLRHPPLVVASTLFVLLAVPLSFWAITDRVPALQTLHGLLLFGNERANLHPLRIVHFLALAYLALSLIEPHRERLASGLVSAIVKVGQQSLAAFLTSLFLARAAGLVLDVTGRDLLATAAVNVAGLSALVAISYAVGWFKSSPWAGSTARPATGAPADAPAGTRNARSLVGAE